MEEKERQLFLGELQQHISPEAGGNKTRFRRTRIMGKISPGGLALFIAAITVSAVLGGYFYSTMNVNMEGDVDITGRTTTSVFTFDGLPIEGGVLELPIDITELTNGDAFSYPHTIRNEDMGRWLITIECSLDAISDPMDPYYGLYFECIPNNFHMMPTEEVALTFWFNASHEFMSPELFGGLATLTVYVNTTIHHDEIPVCFDDALLLEGGGDGDIDPVLNDVDEEPLVMTSYINNDPTLLLITENGGNELNIYAITRPGVGSVSYTVTDEHGNTDTGTLTVTIT